MFGRVKNYYTDKNYGFILGEDGNTYFVHRSYLQGEYISHGYIVYFKPFINDRSDYNAGDIIVIEAADACRH